jgi:uncharacterized protein YegL
MGNAFSGILAKALIGVAVSATVIACGGSDSSSDGTFGPGYPTNAGTGNGGNGGSGNGGLGNSGGTGTGTGTGGTTGVNAMCATSTLGATAAPLHLVFVLDRSGSMCEYAGDGGPRDCKNTSSKWNQATSALKTFVASPDSRGIKASMIVFPYVDNGQCDSTKYQTPIAPEVTLPDTTTLAPAMDKHIAVGGNTPTMNALDGAVTYANSIITATGGKEKVVIVIATDGEPLGCNDAGNINGAANVAKGVASSIPTYVIGVGPDAADLDTLAKAGGTTKAFTASISTPSQTGKQLADALTAIRTATVSCDFAIPAPPSGQTLDYTKVNVQVTSKGTPATAPYSPDCKDPTGWRYDNPAAPKQIELCDTQCTSIKADAYSTVSVVLGCATQTSTVN